MAWARSFIRNVGISLGVEVNDLRALVGDAIFVLRRACFTLLMLELAAQMCCPHCVYTCSWTRLSAFA